MKKENIRIVVITEKCKMSGECLRVCPRDAIIVRDGKAFILREMCDFDGLCISACPNGAIRAIEVEERNA
jgi:MinD superfamily P-loop ATPase